MFNLNRTLIDAFVDHILMAYRETFPAHDPGHDQLLEQASRAALETLLNCDCPYHDIHHTMLVTDVGQAILRGRQIARGDVTNQDWLHSIIALLFHDIGYLRGLLKEDNETGCVVDVKGTRIKPPPGVTDAYMTPYHVTRGSLYIQERFANDAILNLAMISEYIEMTRFPVPQDPFYQRLEGLGALVRAADLIGQMADPLYLPKLSRLFAEFKETGEAQRLGFANSGELREGFPEFYFDQVHPYLGEGLVYLGKTQDGQQWIANLHHHVLPDGPEFKLDHSGDVVPLPKLAVRH